MQNATTKKDGIVRLRESSEALENEHRDNGYEAGKEWALESAEAADLELLAYYFKDADPDCADEVMDAISQDLEYIFGDDIRAKISQAYVRGFVQGALEIWEKV
jgi:hypothetical protein